MAVPMCVSNGGSKKASDCTAGFVARVGWRAWLLTFEQCSKEGILLRGCAGEGDEAENNGSCEHCGIDRCIEEARQEAVNLESSQSRRL